MTRFLPERITARDHAEAYDLWASRFDDPALMANRDARTTRLKLERVVAQLPVESVSAVLDVGPGDGALFHILAARVAHCCGVDPSPNALTKLRTLFAGAENVEFQTGSAQSIPYEEDRFDIVVVNSVLHILPGLGDVEAALRETVRVCKPGGTIFVGELPSRSELGSGIARHVLRKLSEYGLANWARLMTNVYLKPLLRGEPILLYPATNLHVPRAEFEAMCAQLGLEVSCKRHREARRESKTRNDYLLKLRT